MKKISLILGLVLLVVAIPVTVLLARQRQELRKKAAPATTLSLSPAVATKNVGDVFSLDVRIDSGTNQIVATEIHLNFDAEKLEAQSITNGPLFPNILTSGKVGAGTATITVGAASSTKPVVGSGVAAVVRFKTLSGGNQPITVRFATTSFITALGETSQNALIGTTPANITISDSGTSTGPTISATPSPSPATKQTGGAKILPTSPTPTATPTTAPSSTLTPTPTNSAGSGASSSALLILSPAQNANVTQNPPTITGKAAPGATVTLSIYSTTPITVVVTADVNGNWSYTPTTALTTGPHSVVASAQSGGSTQSTSVAFVIASGSATPVAGNFDTTLLFLALGMAMLFGGLLSLRLW